MNRRLDRARAMGDPLADALVGRLVARGELGATNRALAGLSRNDAPLPADLAKGLRRFLEQTGGLPAFADREAIRRAQAFAERHTVSITAALFCAALPTAFAGAKGARVLSQSGRMHDDIDRRIHETGRFVFDVLAPGGLEPAGYAIRSVQKVRLMHAAVRHGLRARAGGQSAREVPINQEDLLGTLFAFSTVVLSALKRLGCEVSAREAEDYYQLWRVVGALLGIARPLLPATLQQARALAARIAERQLRPSPHGQALARVLLGGLERHMPAGWLGPLPRQLIAYLLGQRLSEILGIDSVRGGGASGIPPIALVWRALTDRAGRGSGRRVLEQIIALKLAGARPAFAMPETPRARPGLLASGQARGAYL